VGHVAPLVQGQVQDPVARVEEGGEHDVVCGCSGVGLDIGIPGPEGLLGPIRRQTLDAVHHLAAAVEPGSGKPLRGLVLEDRSQRSEHAPGAAVLRRDQLQRVRDPVVLGHNRVHDLWIRGPELLEQAAVIGLPVQTRRAQSVERIHPRRGRPGDLGDLLVHQHPCPLLSE